MSTLSVTEAIQQRKSIRAFEKGCIPKVGRGNPDPCVPVRIW
jgi:hypothetical protein